MGLMLSIFFGFVPMLAFAWFVYWLDRYEKEPIKLLVQVFLWGALVAAGAAFLINTTLGLGIYLATESEQAAEIATGSMIAPIVEEFLKGFAVLIVFLMHRDEFDSILDGIVYAGITALGFAASENTFYIYNYGFQENGLSGLWGLVFVRVILVGWQHPFYTAFTGIGLAIARRSRSCLVQGLAPLTGLTLAIGLHSFHNTIGEIIPGAAGLILGTILDWTGWFFLFLFILLVIAQERRLLEQYLPEEVSLGVLTAAQARHASSARLQGRVRFKALLNGQYRITHRFFQLCAELAHKKEQLHRLGEEGGNSRIIASLRAELQRLSPLITL